MRELWLLDPVDASALVMRFDGDRFVDVPLAASDELTSQLLPGLSVAVGSLFVR